LRLEHSVEGVENRAARKVFELKREEVTAD
jgi:hypothetical protein